MRLVRTTITALAIFTASIAYASPIVSTGVFAGDMTESWESFENYRTNPELYLPEVTDIFGGQATISNPYMVIYEPGSATFNLSRNGSAQVADGFNGLGIDQETAGFHNQDPTADITFTTPVSSFGGFWGSCFQGSVQCFGGGLITVTFFDSSNSLIDSINFTYDHTGTADGILDWHGWTSSTPIARVSYAGDYVVNDSLRANRVPVPEPSTFGLIGIGLAAVRGFRRRSL